MFYARFIPALKPLSSNGARAQTKQSIWTEIKRNTRDVPDIQLASRLSLCFIPDENGEMKHEK